MTCKHCKKPRVGAQRVTGGRWRGTGKRGASENMSGQVQTREEAGLCTCVMVELKAIPPNSKNPPCRSVFPSREVFADEVALEAPTAKSLHSLISDSENEEFFVTDGSGLMVKVKIQNLWEVLA